MARPGDEVTLPFGGNATTLLRLGQFTLLTDPNFIGRGQRVYLGKGLWTRRLTDPAILPEDLPDLDAVLLSHLHGAHWDRIAHATTHHHTPAAPPPPPRRPPPPPARRPLGPDRLRDDRPRHTGHHDPGRVPDADLLRVPGDGGPAPLAGARDRRRRRGAAGYP